MTNKPIIVDGVDVRECACIIEDYYYQKANNLTNEYKHIKNVCELCESGSEHYNLFCKDNPSCYFKQLKRKEKVCKEWKEEYRAKVEELNELEEKLLRKEQECEDLRQYHNKCCEEFKKEKQDLIDKYNQLSINFYNGDYCNTEHCSLLKSKEKECDELKKTIMYKCPQCGEEYLNPIGASLYEENNKLKQTLTEIKDIAEEDFNHTCWETYARQLEQILQKIS